MKMVNIGYVSLIPQNLEGILEDLIDGGGGSGGSGGVILSVGENDGLLDPDGKPLTYTGLVELASQSICYIVSVDTNGVFVGYLARVFHEDGEGYIANFTYVISGDSGYTTSVETYIAESADAQLILD